MDVSADEALRLIGENESDLGAEEVELTSALARVCFEPIIAKVALPSFDNSAMDGFAVRSQESRHASMDHVLRLAVVGSITAGSTILRKPTQGTGVCHQINTGAPFPPGFDACVKVEDVKMMSDAAGHEFIELEKPVPPMQHRRKIGEEVAVGVQLVDRGVRLKPEHMAVLASQGLVCLRVFRNLRIAIISTGKELVQTGRSLDYGQIYDTNARYVQACLAAWHYPVATVDSVGDDELLFQELVTSKSKYDVVITTGAVSKGKTDFVASSLRKIGATIMFHGVAIRPGHPLLFATFGQARVFSLPGNPGAVALCLRLFAYPYLQRMYAQPPELAIEARLARAITKRHDLRVYRKAKLQYLKGTVCVEILEGSHASLCLPFMEANAWAQLKEGEGVFQEGSFVSVFLQHPCTFL